MVFACQNFSISPDFFIIKGILPGYRKKLHSDVPSAGRTMPRSVIPVIMPQLECNTFLREVRKIIKN